MFDFNGTLIDDLNVSYGVTCNIFELLNLKSPDLSVYRSEISADAEKFFRDRGVPSNITREELGKMRCRFFNKKLNDVKLRDDVVSVLQKCRDLDIELAIVSGEVLSVILNVLSQFNILDYFKHIQGDAWPKKYALAEMLDICKVKADEAFYVDDTVIGIKAAKENKIKVFGYTGGYDSPQSIEEAEPDYVLNSLSDILKYLS